MSDKNMIWKPIETAPTDGTYVLVKIKGVYAKSGRAFVPSVAAFVDGRWTEVDDEEDEDDWRPCLWTNLPKSDDGLDYVNALD